jgi:molecular chaperone DnaK
VEARNQLDALVHSTDKTLKESGDKVPPAEKAEVETALTAARSAMEGQDADAIRDASEKLSQAAMKMGEALYKAEQAAPKPEEGAPGAGAAGASKDKVVDAEFEEVDPNKKKPS